MIKYSLFLLFLPVFLFSNEKNYSFVPAPYYDFGVIGKTYPIEERNIMDEIKEEFKNFKLTKEDFRKAAEKAIAEKAFYKSELPLCSIGKSYPEEIDSSTLKENMYSPYGKIIRKKGDLITVPLPKGAEFSLCFISGKNYINGLNQINYLEHKEREGKCLYLISDRDIRDYRKAFPELDIYTSSKVQEDRFNIKCYPSEVNLYKEKRKLTQYQHSRFNN